MVVYIIGWMDGWKDRQKDNELKHENTFTFSTFTVTSLPSLKYIAYVFVKHTIAHTQTHPNCAWSLRFIIERHQ